MTVLILAPALDSSLDMFWSESGSMSFCEIVG